MRTTVERVKDGKDGLRMTAERGNDEDDLETNKDYKTV